ncbi:GNAT family N-acetyltransferase [Alicyclobacillus ferrooxydans]|uniref:GNAT family N-acetyltransferase n=1 Tax=Alicyclobacillus ferrooxydans TaxID=471514 RepID=UPI0006D5B58A|nr:GNAT family N-acetyltransferase [Alicyclobacillus ferrooxydans]
MTVDIRRVTSLADCDTARAIAATVWGSDAACSTPQMSVHANYGGVVLLAYAGSEPVGFLFSFPALYRGEWVLWSHETAVLPEYLHQGIGSALKLYQRTAATELGYRSIAWTFDPLVSRNAHFNLNKLGANVVEYKVNAYGADEKDLVNQGIETDRFIALWDVNVGQTIQGIKSDQEGIMEHRGFAEQYGLSDQQDLLETRQHTILAVGSDDEPLVHIHQTPARVAGTGHMLLGHKWDPGACGDEVFHTRIPLELPARRETRGLWREVFRDAALSLFKSGYTPVQFRRTKGYGEYIWAK